MNSRIKIIAQEIDNKTNQLISEHIIYEKKASAPARINDLGFSHKEQMGILYHSQEAILQAQEKLINEKNCFMHLSFVYCNSNECAIQKSKFFK